MISRTVSFIAITWLLISASSKADTAKKDFGLQVYLPREVTIKNDIPTLGQVGIIRGEESLSAKASEITLGRISLPGQEITVDRRVVLSRLACNGIPSATVVLTGAEKVLVKREHQVIKGSRFVEKALSFVEKNPPDDTVCEFSPIRIPKDLVIHGKNQDMKLLPHLVKSSIRNRAKVRVTVLAQGQEIGMREVSFQLKYNCRRAVTTIDIPRGAVVSPENMKTEKITSNYPESANWVLPYGLITKRRLPANTVIRPDMVELPKPPVLLKRNQNVIIKIDKPGLLVTAIGKTIQEGRVGEYIKVRNVDSQRIILAKVNEDGTVEPVF